MTDKITLELTLEELKTLDKHIEYNEEIKSVFDKIKDAYPQPKMNLYREGEYAIVSYNDTTYYRFRGEDTSSWYIKKGVNDGYPVPTLMMINDAETERLLEGLHYNHIEVKKEKEQEEWKSAALKFGRKFPVILPYSYNEFSPNAWYKWAIFVFDEYVKQRDIECGFTPKEIKELVKEGLEWCKDHPNENPLDWVKPQTPEQVEQGLKEAFREAVKQGVVSSTTYTALTDLIFDWWEDVFTTNSNDDMEICIDTLVDRIEAWLPVEQSAAGSQNAYVECTVEGFNDCLNGIKRKLR